MTIRPLVIDGEAKAEIARVKAHAEANFITFDEMKAKAEAEVPPPAIGDDPNFSCQLKFGYRVTFSVEKQPMGWCHHISVSVDEKGKYPNEAAVTTIMKEFGMTKPLTDCIVYDEKEFGAINVISLI